MYHRKTITQISSTCERLKCLACINGDFNILTLVSFLMLMLYHAKPKIIRIILNMMTCIELLLSFITFLVFRLFPKLIIVSWCLVCILKFHLCITHMYLFSQFNSIYTISFHNFRSRSRHTYDWMICTAIYKRESLSYLQS